MLGGNPKRSEGTAGILSHHSSRPSRYALAGALLERLEVAKLAAVDSGTPPPFSMGEYD